MNQKGHRGARNLTLRRRGARGNSVSVQAVHSMTTYGMPLFLRKLKKKHVAMAKIEMQKRAFAAIHKSELDSISLIKEYDACWQCGETTGHLVNVQHESDSTCTCKMHEACLVAWTRAYEAKGKRVRICPACRCKRKGWQPKKYPAPLCGSVVANAFCTKPLGHIGNCA